MYEGSNFSTSSLGFIVTIFYSSHSIRCMELRRCVLPCISLIANGLTTFHVLICFLYLLLGEMSVHIFSPFLNWNFFLTVDL